MPSRRIAVVALFMFTGLVAVPYVHAAEPEMPPVVVDGGGAAAPGGPVDDPNAPAPGAQPAAPGAVGELPQVDVEAANPADVAADAAGIDADPQVEEVAADAGEVVAPIAAIEDGVGIEPVEVEATPAPVAGPAAPMPTVDGGGTDGADAGGALAAPVAAYQPAGALPFTGATENLLLALLAGVLVPIGVLLYSAARHGDLRRRRRVLSMPRFQWAATSRFDGDALRPRQELDSFDWAGAGASPVRRPW